MIEGIKIVDLKTHKDERGFFKEILRIKKDAKNFDKGQLSHSFVKKNILKAWHAHKYQSQWNYVINGAIKVALYDLRKNSTTQHKYFEFYAGDNYQNIAYFFPPGVLHGYLCINGPMNILYFTSGEYDLNDEIRLSVNDKNIEYKWKKIKK